MKYADKQKKILLSFVVLALTISIGCASDDSGSSPDSPKIRYTKAKDVIQLEVKNPYFVEVLKECESVFIGCRDVLDEAITDKQLKMWRSEGAIEILYDSPRQFDIPGPLNYSLQVKSLLILLGKDGSESKPLPIKIVAFFSPRGLDVFVNTSYDLKVLKKLILTAVKAGDDTATSESGDIEMHVGELIKKKDYSKGISIYLEAINSTKDKSAKSRYYFNLANIYKLLKDKGGQRKCLQNAANMTPDVAVRYDYLELLGRLLIDSDQMKEARKVLEEVLDNSKKDWQIKSGRMSLYRIDLAEGKLQATVASLENQLKKNPQSVQLHEDLATIYDYILKDYSIAIPVYEKLSKLQPDEPLILTRLQFCYEQTGQLDKAIAVYDTMMKKDPEAALKVLELALKMAIRAEQPQTAIRWGKKYVESKPNDPEVHGKFARIAFQVADYKLASESLAKAESLATSSKQRDAFIVEQVAVAEKAGDREAMEKHIRRLIKTTESDEAQETGFIMLVKFLKQEKRLQELITW